MIKFGYKILYMRYLFLLILACVCIISCKKDKYTSAPQISYKSIENNFISSAVTNSGPAFVNFELTDAEGDIGFKGKDTAFIFIKNLLTGLSDSLIFPDLNKIASKNFLGVVNASLDKVTKCKSLPGNIIHTDTIYYEIYVKDFAKNKSNIIKTGDPVYFRCQ
jgi:hypothetical protein